MAAQNLKMQRGVGAFIVDGSVLTTDSGLGFDYPSAAGTIDFTTRSVEEQNMLTGGNHPTTPQHASVTPTVAFLYSPWTTTS